jgi:glutathione S-transferase
MLGRMKIYGVPFSVHTRKVLVAARLKALAVDVIPVVPVIPDNPPPNWRDISPTGLVPAIDDDGYVLPDSTAIILYLERKQPTPALLPSDARAYGMALFLDAWAGSALFRSVVHPLFHNQIVAPNIHKTPGDAAAITRALEQAAPEAFAYLEGRRPDRFLVGSALSIADLAVASNLVMFRYLGHRIDERRYPRLFAWFERLRSSDPFAAALAAERAAVGTVAGLDPAI